MKKILLIVALIAAAFTQKSFAQNKTEQVQPAQLLSLYYNIKDALVSSNSTTAAINAEQFVKTINGISDRTISEQNRNALLKDAGVFLIVKTLNNNVKFLQTFPLICMHWLNL